MKLTLLSESRRLAPAVITMKRGTVIKADHARLVRTSPNTSMLVVGFGPGKFSYITTKSGNSLSTPLVRMMRDFYYPDRYEPTPWQDETGWHEPGIRPGLGSGGNGPDGYSVHRNCVATRKFRHIITIIPDNIRSIQWG